MLVWKIQTLNINVASLRYRCLLPLRYLSHHGLESKIYGGLATVKLTPQTKAIIFVKSFHHADVATCKRAYQQGVPIILDLCDNIFIEGYGADSDHIAAQNFQIMAQMADVIVTTGTAMKAEVEKALSIEQVPDEQVSDEQVSDEQVPDEQVSELAHSSHPHSNHSQTAPRVITIPDGSESLEDIQFAFKSTKWARAFKQATKPLHVARRLYKEGRHAAKVALCDAGLLSPKEIPPEHTATGHLTCPNPTHTKHANKSSKKPKKNKSQPTPLRPKPWPPAPGVKTVLWFGNHGAKYGNFGMLNILDVADALQAVNASCSLRLMVISNHREKYEADIAPLPFETDYLRWHPLKIYDYIRASDVVIIPNSQSRYSICKSANRAVLALSQGTPVVASRTPALDGLKGCVWLDDWEGGLREYLLNPQVGEAHVEQAQQLIAQTLSGEAIAQKWLTLLDQIGAYPSEAYPSGTHSSISKHSAGERNPA
ncbi:MAG: hypothetical protein AB8B99_07925 [Phormidesmis sp.]